jgi:hypothetical protein
VASGPWDVFLGGSVLRRDGVNNFGFTLQVAEYPYKSTPWVGGMVDISGHYGSYGPVSLSTYTTMAGITLAHRCGRLQPSLHFLAGAAETHSSAVYSGTTLNEAVNNFGYQMGAGADLHLGHHWGFRAQGDWFTVTIDSQMDFFYRASGGVKFDF